MDMVDDFRNFSQTHKPSFSENTLAMSNLHGECLKGQRKKLDASR